MIIDLAILVILAALVWWLLTQIPLPEPINKAVQIVFVVIVVLALIGILTGSGGIGLHGRLFTR